MLIELTKQIKLVRPEAKAVYPYSNSVYIDDEIKTMIDAGSGGRAYTDIPREEIRLLLLTHHHFDHINGWVFFNRAKIMAGLEERWAFEDEDQYNRNIGYQRWQEFMAIPRDEILRKSLEMPDDVPTRPGFQHIALDGVFKDGDRFDFGATSVQAVHTPGHSPGHYAFFFPQERILFSADLDVSSRGPWYGNESSNLDDLINSIHKLMALHPEVLVSSHRKVIISGIQEALLAYLDIALQREIRIMEYLTEPKSINDIANQNYINEWERGSPPNEFWQKMMILKHLERLQRQGRVKKNEDNRYARI